MMVLSSAGSFLLSRTQWRELRPSYLLWLATALGSLAILVAAAQGNQIDLVGMLAQSIRLATPIALGALAGIYCERSGVINIAIEGMMLTAACFGILGNLIWGNIWAGLGLAVVSAMVIALLHAVLSIKFKTNQIVSGTVLNILAVGITGFVRRTWLLQTGGREVFPILPIPVLSRIPVIGEMFFNNGPMVYAMFILMIVTQVVLFHTVWGLRTRAVGEHPRAADTVGINVYWVRYANVIVSGLIAGLGGAWFSLETTGGFDDNMTNGKGFIALAAMIFGKWTPFGAMSGAMLFGFADAVQFKFQILNVPVPYQFLSIIPYVVTIIVLTGVMGRAIPPAAVGKPYEK
ncbi:MAG: ABC transporter permease [Chloroflexi bacterium]|nr:ABC transporter permease [Chloroflexota bacterium]